LARTVYRTRPASGSGTVGYAAPEQVMGKPSIRSDVFAAGLVLWRLFGGRLPDWPFRWPYERADRLEERFGPDAMRIVRRATKVDQTKRFQSAAPMLTAFQRARDRAPG
jgi:serine/threonine-protein kinase